MAEEQASPSTREEAVPGQLDQSAHPVLRALGWVSVGLSLAAVSLVVGRELRKRYKFNRRTPYDFFSKAGAQAASEFGMGV